MPPGWSGARSASRRRGRIGASRIAADATATLPDGIPLTAAAISRGARFSAQARVAALRLEDIAALLPAAARGRGELAVTARAEGTGQAWRGTATLAASRAEVAATALRQVSATATFDGAHIEVTELRAEAQDLPLRASGTWQWAGGGRAGATIGPGPLAGVGPPGLGVAGTGRASVELLRAGPALIVEGTDRPRSTGWSYRASRWDAGARTSRPATAYPRQLGFPSGTDGHRGGHDRARR